MEITLDRLCDMLEDADEEFEYIEENITGGKHSDQYIELIVKNRTSGEFMGVSYSRSYEWGIHDYGDFELCPMKAVQKTVYVPA
jgi:hypothetical protein